MKAKPPKRDLLLSPAAPENAINIGSYEILSEPYAFNDWQLPSSLHVRNSCRAYNVRGIPTANESIEVFERELLRLTGIARANCQQYSKRNITERSRGIAWKCGSFSSRLNPGL